MKAFNDIADFTHEEIRALLDLATRLDTNPEPEALKGKVLSLLFLSPSFAHAGVVSSCHDTARRWGPLSFLRICRYTASNRGPASSWTGLPPNTSVKPYPSSHLTEMRSVFERLPSARICSMTYRSESFSSLTALIDTPYINMESAMSHPCQKPRRLENVGRSRDTRKRRQIRVELGLPSQGIAPRGPGLHIADGRAAGHGRYGAATGWICTAGSGHDKRARRSRCCRRPGPRIVGAARSHARRPCDLRQIVVFDNPLRGSQCRRRTATRTGPLVRRRIVVRECAGRLPLYALPAGAPRRRGRRRYPRRTTQCCHSGGAQSDAGTDGRFASDVGE